MENLYSNGWFKNQQNSTGALSNLGPRCILAVSLLNASTGVLADDISLLLQNQKNDSIISSPLYIIRPKSSRTAFEDLDQIRKVLSPVTTDLARSLNVSRQTIYNWQNGEQPTSDHTIKLKDLACAADIFSEAGIKVDQALLRRKVIKGKNFFDNVQEGGSAQDFAQMLLRIVRNESEQRARLTARFANRKIPQSSPDFDIMPDNDSL